MLQNCAAACIRLRQTLQMVFKVRFDLRLGLFDESEAAFVTSESGQCANGKAAGKPKRRQPTRVATEFIDALRTPGKMVVLLLGCIEQVLARCRRARKQGLSVIKRLSGYFTSVVYPHEPHAQRRRCRVEGWAIHGIVATRHGASRLRFGEACPQPFARTRQCCVDQAFANAHATEVYPLQTVISVAIIAALRHMECSTVRYFRILAAAAILTAGTAFAQEEEEEQDPFEGAASLGYQSTSGNSDNESLSAALSIKWQPSLWSHEFGFTAFSAETNGVESSDATFADYVARREFGEKSYLFAAAHWESDEFSAYDNQFSQTVGYGRHMIATERHVLDLEIGAGARQAELQSGIEEDESITRGALDYTWQISETAEFGQTLAFESGSSNTRTESRTELRANIFGNVALVLAYRMRNNSDVPPGVDKTDSWTTISLEYGF